MSLHTFIIALAFKRVCSASRGRMITDRLLRVLYASMGSFRTRGFLLDTLVFDGTCSGSTILSR
jgi:hypothetical protein